LWVNHNASPSQHSNKHVFSSCLNCSASMSVRLRKKNRRMFHDAQLWACGSKKHLNHSDWLCKSRKLSGGIGNRLIIMRSLTVPLLRNACGAERRSIKHRTLRHMRVCNYQQRNVCLCTAIALRGAHGQKIRRGRPPQIVCI